MQVPMGERLELRLVCRRWASIQRCLTFALHTTPATAGGGNAATNPQVRPVRSKGTNQSDRLNRAATLQLDSLAWGSFSSEAVNVCP